MKIALEDRDFVQALGKEEMESRIHGRAGVLGKAAGGGSDDSREKAVVDALPRALANRVRSMLGDDLVLSEMRITFSVEGKPFGVGIGGEVEVVLRAP
jgi:hypothetical protein